MSTIEIRIRNLEKEKADLMRDLAVSHGKEYELCYQKITCIIGEIKILTDEYFDAKKLERDAEISDSRKIAMISCGNVTCNTGLAVPLSELNVIHLCPECGDKMHTKEEFEKLLC